MTKIRRAAVAIGVTAVLAAGAIGAGFGSRTRSGDTLAVRDGEGCRSPRMPVGGSLLDPPTSFGIEIRLRDRIHPAGHLLVAVYALDADTQWHLVMVTCVLAILPPVLVVVLMQRWFVRGLVESEK